MRRKKYLLALTIVFLGLFVLATAGQAMAADQRNLSWGCNGNDVATLQSTLNNLGFNSGNVDGIFGPKTYNAVVNFQRARGLIVDGIVGPQTRAALYGSNTASTQNTTPSRGGSRVLTMLATAYDPGPECNDQWAGISYLGTPLHYGIVAVDPNVIPLGSKLYVEGYGEAYAADTGGAIKGNRIDLCYDTYQEAMDFGMKYVKVYILSTP